MDHEMPKSKVYVKLDSDGHIVRIDGGYTSNNITDPENWTLIDEGTGDRYNLCQSNYLDKEILTVSGVYRYKLMDGKPVECTAEEIAEQEANLPKPQPTPTFEELDAAYQEGVNSL